MKELVIRMNEAEQETTAFVNAIMAKHNLPCFIYETIFDKVHRKLNEGKTAELAAAMAKQEEK